QRLIEGGEGADFVDGPQRSAACKRKADARAPGRCATLNGAALGGGPFVHRCPSDERAAGAARSPPASAGRMRARREGARRGTEPRSAAGRSFIDVLRTNAPRARLVRRRQG